jgi:hypothetical protein
MSDARAATVPQWRHDPRLSRAGDRDMSLPRKRGYPHRGGANGDVP